jgi:hypothetical protein
MSQSGAVLLNAYPNRLVKLACTKCSRKGQYEKGNLIVKHGAAIGLPDLLRAVAKCERWGNMSNGCGAYYSNIEKEG